jgi:hypothetical protein
MIPGWLEPDSIQLRNSYTYYPPLIACHSYPPSLGPSYYNWPPHTDKAHASVSPPPDSCEEAPLRFPTADIVSPPPPQPPGHGDA